jgi:hypothetical protein
MRQHWTPEKSRVFAVRMERQLEGVIDAARAHDPEPKTILRESCTAAHEAVVDLITLYRDHVAGANAVATHIAQAYAGCVVGTAEIPATACIERVLHTARGARERYLGAGPDR